MPPLLTLAGRSSGLLLHPSCLPNDYGIGDIGPAAHRFLDFLSAAGQRWWQMLPLNPLGQGNSPYRSYSSFAVNPLLLSPELLVQAGWLKKSELSSFQSPLWNQVDYNKVGWMKMRCLAMAFDRFEVSVRAKDHDRLAEFVHDQRSWLPDVSLFLALRRRHGGKEWWTWEPALRHRQRAALAAARQSFVKELHYHQFTQWQFSLQWEELRKHAARQHIEFIGDMPIFVAADSADVWAHADLFTLHADGSPASVAGVGPDYFSKTGQLWGNPHYRWPVMKKNGYACT